ncbi:hypothetical protein ACIGKR_30390 [Rhodococcus qingshengii]|uniref:hypothetical protein n=1 Tax=Rhodococcus qingshengii TaxID=334542 RepID=UPI0037CB508E
MTAVPAPTAMPAIASARRTPTVVPRTVAAAIANATSAEAGRGLVIAEPLSMLPTWSGLPHRHSGEHLLHLRPSESEVRSVHLDACVPLRSEGIEHDPGSRSEYVPLDGNNGVGIPTQLPVDGIGFTEPDVRRSDT